MISPSQSAIVMIRRDLQLMQPGIFGSFLDCHSFEVTFEKILVFSSLEKSFDLRRILSSDRIPAKSFRKFLV
jgi:hypothetical protein